MTRLARIRPSNLVIFAVLPFIVYLFIAVPNYRRSIIAIVGVEDNAAWLLRDAGLISLILALGCLLPFAIYRGWRDHPFWKKVALLAALLGPALAGALAMWSDLSLLAGSILANIVDPTTSDWVERAVTPRRLTSEAMTTVAAEAPRYVGYYALVAGLLTAAALPFAVAGRARLLGQAALVGLFASNTILLAYLLLAAHLGFAAGLFTTLRAGIFAYLLACVLGLLWASLMRMKSKRRTTLRYAIACAAMLAGAIALFSQPHATYVLVGTLDKSVAIVKGTPKQLVDTIRFGAFDETIAAEVGLRSAASVEHALKLLDAGTEVSAAFLPAEAAPAGRPEIWRTSFLPSVYETPAIFLLVTGLLLGLLTFSAFQHNRHPLAVSAEFFVDTVRGIPMLVIILFVGLPLAGSVKDATGGVIDMPNALRGVIAIAIGYSAYLAEIFRAGIDAVPRGQIEAARTLGLSSWQLARLIVFPQAFRVIIPPLGNEFIAMLKDTSLLSILSVRDVTQRMREFQSASFLPFAPFNSAAILYVCLTLAAASLISFVERKYDIKSR